MAGIGIIALMLAAVLLVKYIVPMLILGAVGGAGIILCVTALMGRRIRKKPKAVMLTLGTIFLLASPVYTAVEITRLWLIR